MTDWQKQPTFHRGSRDFGTGFDMMTRIEELEAELAEAKRHLEKMLVWSDDLSLQCAEIRPKFREDYNAAAGFLDGDDDNG